MRLIIFLLTLSIGALVSLILGASHRIVPTPASAGVSHTSEMTWATTTDPHKDPQVSIAPPLKTPPQPAH